MSCPGNSSGKCWPHAGSALRKTDSLLCTRAAIKTTRCRPFTLEEQTQGSGAGGVLLLFFLKASISLAIQGSGFCWAMFKIKIKKNFTVTPTTYKHTAKRNNIPPGSQDNMQVFTWPYTVNNIQRLFTHVSTCTLNHWIPFRFHLTECKQTQDALWSYYDRPTQTTFRGRLRLISTTFNTSVIVFSVSTYSCINSCVCCVLTNRWG